MNLSGGLALRQNARGRARRDGGERQTLLGLESERPQAVQELALDFLGVRLQQHGQPLQMHAELVAEYVRGVGQFRRKLSRLHDNLSAE